MWRCILARSRKCEVILQGHFIINSENKTYLDTFRRWDILDNFKATWPHVLRLAAPHVCCRKYLVTQSQTFAVWPSEPVDLNSHDFSCWEISDEARKHPVCVWQLWMTFTRQDIILRNQTKVYIYKYFVRGFNAHLKLLTPTLFQSKLPLPKNIITEYVDGLKMLLFCSGFRTLVRTLVFIGPCIILIVE